MNILFLTLMRITTTNESNIYLDILNELKKDNKVYIVSPCERRDNNKNEYLKEENVEIIRPKILNIQKTNLLEKGLSTISVERKYIQYIKKYCANVKFDLVVYSTPPVTFGNVVKFIKKRDKCTSYLLLKDIFPQNAIDLKMMNEKGLMYKYFRKKEVDLYKQSDYIGCMSPANKKYLLKHNNFINEAKIEINPNSSKIIENEFLNVNPEKIKDKYDLPNNKTLLVYGGNLGKPQNVDFIISTIKECEVLENYFFVICGSGTEYNKLEKFYNDYKPNNLRLLNSLPKREFEELVYSCDIGLIFLDYRFTIPNYPSRLLSYLKCSKPILAITDKNTDVGTIAESNKYGISCESNDVKNVVNSLTILTNKNLKQMGENGYFYYVKSYDCKISAKKIIKVKEKNNESI